MWGKPKDAVYLYVHGQGGRKEEAELFANIAEKKGWQVISMDLPGYGEREEEIAHFDPWHVTPELTEVMQYIRERCNSDRFWTDLILGLLSVCKEECNYGVETSNEYFIWNEKSFD